MGERSLWVRSATSRCWCVAVRVPPSPREVAPIRRRADMIQWTVGVTTGIPPRSRRPSKLSCSPWCARWRPRSAVRAARNPAAPPARRHPAGSRDPAALLSLPSPNSLAQTRRTGALARTFVSATTSLSDPTARQGEFRQRGRWRTAECGAASLRGAPDGAVGEYARVTSRQPASRAARSRTRARSAVQLDAPWRGRSHAGRGATWPSRSQ